MTSVSNLCNRALRAAGSEHFLGSIREGSFESKVLLEQYVPTRQQLLSAAHWNFARKQAPIQLLADATGQTAGVGNVVVQPWTYEYAWPIDGLKARFVPCNSCQLQAPQTPTPIMTGLGLPPQNAVRLIPARFLVGLDWNYPIVQGGVAAWSQVPDFSTIQGGSPAQRTVVLTNVQQAQLIYTADVESPDEWSPLFQEAFVQVLASRIAQTVTRDKKFGIQKAKETSGAARGAITQARATDGNEGWTTTDHTPDWIRIRNFGPGGWWAPGFGGGWGGDGFGGGPGCFGYGWDSIGLGDGSAF